MAQRILSTEYRRLVSLWLDPQNPRRHNKKQIRVNRTQHRDLGFDVPLLVDARGQLIAGHGRVLVAQL